jgi:hypothetical protein
VPDDDVVFVFNPLRRVRVTREDVEWFEHNWLTTEDRTEAARWLGVAIRGALDKGRDVMLDPHTRYDLNMVLSRADKQERLATPGLRELYEVSRDPSAL